MELRDFVIEGMTRVRNNTLRVVKDLSPAQLHWRPGHDANSVAFLLWHTARTEDRLMCSLRAGQKQVWEKNGWDKRYGIPENDAGHDWTMAQVDAFKPSLHDLLEYSEQVRLTTLDVVREMDMGRLGEKPSPAFPSFTTSHILQVFMTHESHHQGAIEYIAGLARSNGL